MPVGRCYLESDYRDAERVCVVNYTCVLLLVDGALYEQAVWLAEACIDGRRSSETTYSPAQIAHVVVTTDDAASWSVLATPVSLSPVLTEAPLNSVNTVSCYYSTLIEVQSVVMSVSVCLYEFLNLSVCLHIS